MVGRAGRVPHGRMRYLLESSIHRFQSRALATSKHSCVQSSGAHSRRLPSVTMWTDDLYRARLGPSMFYNTSALP